MEKLSVFLSGLLFGAGVTVSGMVNPAKVLNFLDIAGTWDPTLICVMAGGLAVTTAGYRLLFRRDTPLFAKAFAVPATQAIDAPLMAGAALFGLGWGLAGFCPGPAIASLVFGRSEAMLFVGAMLVGMLAAKILRGRLRQGVQPSA
jgi:uncharacterized protein